MSKSPTTKTATTGRNRPEARTWTAAQNWTITAIANVLNKTERELKEVFSGTDFATLMAEVEDWKATAGKPIVPSILRITSQNSAQPTSDQLYSEIMRRGVEKHRVLLSLGPTATIIDDDLQTMSRLYSCNARRKTRARGGQETPNPTPSKPISLPIRQSSTTPTVAGSSPVGREPPSSAKLRPLGEGAEKRPASESPLSDLVAPHSASRLKTSNPTCMLLVRWLNWKPGAVEADVEEDSEAVPKTFDELVGWIQERFSLQDFGCKINFSELRCSTLPPLDGASGMISTIKFDHTVIDAKKYRIARVVAHMRGQLWLTFETIDDATRRSSTAAPASVGGSKPSGGESDKVGGGKKKRNEQS